MILPSVEVIIMGLSWWISKRTIPLPYCQIEQQKPWQPGKKDYPGIEILCHRTYKRRMIQGSPNAIQQVRQQGHKIKDIAYHLGMGKRTVYYLPVSRDISRMAVVQTTMQEHVRSLQVLSHRSMELGTSAY